MKIIETAAEYPQPAPAVNAKSAPGDSAGPAAAAPEGEAAPAKAPPPGTLTRQRRRRSRPFALAFALLAIIVAGAGLIAGRLAAGPVSLTWAIPLVLPLIDERLDGSRVDAGKAEFDWQNWRPGPTLRLTGVNIAGADFSLRADRLSATFASHRLIAGALQPTSLDAGGLHLVMPLPAGGGDGQAGGDGGTLLVDLLEPPALSPLATLDRITIADADLTLVDGSSGPVWQARIADARLERGSAGLTGRVALDLDHRGSRGTANLELAAVTAGGGGAAVRLDFAGLELAVLAPVMDPLLPLTAVALPLTGSLNARVDAAGRLAAASVTATGGPGALVLSRELARHYKLPATAVQRLPIDRLTLKGRADPAAAAWTIEELSIVGSEGAEVSLPAPVERRVPFRRLDAALAFSPAALSLDGLHIDIGGTVLSLAGALEDPLGAAAGRLNGSIQGASVATVIAYWPRQIATDAYDWINTHLKAGRIEDARLAVTLAPEAGATAVSALALSLPVEGAVVDYLPPLPPIEDGQVTVDVTLETLTARVRRARVGGLTLTEGDIVIPNLEADVPSIDIGLRAAGPVAAIAAVLATPPLDVLDPAELAPIRTAGSIDARIRLGFPLLDEIELEQMRIAVDATTSGVGAAGLPNDIVISDGNLRITATEQGLQAMGPIAVSGIAGVLDWQEDFQPATPLRTDLAFRIVKASAGAVRRGLARFVDLDEALTGGSFSGLVRLTLRDDGDAAVTGRLDLTQAALAAPMLRWAKPAGVPSTLEAEVDLAGGRIDAIERVAFTAGDADVSGRAMFAADGSLDTVQIERFRLGQTQLAGSLRALDPDGAAKGWSISISGKALDLAPFLAPGDGAETPAARSAEKEKKKQIEADGGQPADGFETLFLSADIDTVWVGGAQPTKRMLVTVAREAGDWRLIQVKGETEDGAPFALDLVPADGHGRLTVRAADAGATLAALGILPTMRGGRLRGDGRLETDAAGGARVKGEVRIDDFRLVQAPLLARLLEVMALTGLRDVLTGRGMFFSALRFPFVYAGGGIELDDARASGPSLGLTISGRIDLDTETLDLRGAVVPFYWANSLIGRLPVIGTWLIGGQPGGGLFSATYRATGPLDAPSLAVNPFSIVLPSVVRMLLELIQGWAAPSANGAVP